MYSTSTDARNLDIFRACERAFQNPHTDSRQEEERLRFHIFQTLDYVDS